MRMLFGQETELFFTVLGKKGIIPNRSLFIQEFLRYARRLPHLPGPHEQGVFLPGAYLYLDCGEHIEAVTVECCNPWDLLKSKLAAEAIITKVADDVMAANPGIGELIISKVNVDYTGAGTTWGEHESYLLHRHTDRFDEQQLIPHLVSRIIYTGAGGWHSTSPGLLYFLSPRVPFYTHVVSPDSTKFRGIFHTRDEPLTGLGYTYKRLHVICGEGLFSHKASLLKTGITALVVRLIDIGKSPGERVRLRSPLDCFNTFARDTRCDARAETIGGEVLTAVDIQRHYLSEVYKHIGELPAWAPELCILWKETLDALESGPHELTGVLDWPTKLEIFSRYIDSRGYSWDAIGAWNLCLKEINETAGPVPDVNFLKRWLRSQDNRFAGLRIHRILKKHRLDVERLSDFIAMRDKLFEIDIRFGQIGGNGIFSVLDRQGVLRHHVEGITDEEVEQAREKPPEGSRATIRGEWIKLLSGNPGRYRCHWTHIVDRYTRKVLNLYDPFEARERWEAPG